MNALDANRTLNTSSVSLLKYPGYTHPESAPINIDLSQFRPATASSGSEISQEAREKALREVANTKSQMIQAQASHSLLINDPQIGEWVNAIEDHAPIGINDMAGLISTALNAPAGSGTANTLSQDLALSKAKLNYLVTKFIPPAQQDAAGALVDRYIEQKTQGQDNVYIALKKTQLAIDKQTGNGEETQTQQALDALQHGQAALQTQRSAMLHLVDDTTNSADWFTTLRQTLPASSGDYDPGHSIELAHIDALQAQWEAFTAEVARLTASHA
ncbi:hypothetical protein [Pantoea sp.]|uniref:hypothetical protein n=1 Tax=Pantoea sp. TaxID=69393 RepID=UPI0031D81B0F